MRRIIGISLELSVPTLNAVVHNSPILLANQRLMSYSLSTLATIVAENCRRKRRLSHKTATAATVAVFGDSVDRALGRPTSVNRPTQQWVSSRE